MCMKMMLPVVLVVRAVAEVVAVQLEEVVVVAALLVVVDVPQEQGSLQVVLVSLHRTCIRAGVQPGFTDRGVILLQLTQVIQHLSMDLQIQRWADPVLEQIRHQLNQPCGRAQHLLIQFIRLQLSLRLCLLLTYSPALQDSESN